MKAIVIDDSRAMRIVLRKSLTQQGFEVVEAGDGRQALDQLEANGPVDLAVVDWNMPVMDGYEFICEARSRPAMAPMAIMMLTTESDKAQVQRALASIRSILADLDRFWEKEQTKGEVLTFILDAIYPNLPTPPYTEEEKELIAANVYAHASRQAMSGAPGWSASGPN